MRPLEDLRIIAVEQYGAGPFGSVHLADLGAEVIKIEDPRAGGDVGRYVPPYAEDEDSLFFETFNRNKRSVSPRLWHRRRARASSRNSSRSPTSSTPTCAATCRRSCASGTTTSAPQPAHRVRVADRVRDDRAAREEPGYDYVLQGLAGWMELTGEPDGPPTKSGLSLVDYSGGFVAAISLLAGVHAARRDGVGMDCDVSLYDTAVGDADLSRRRGTSTPGSSRSARTTRPTRRSCRSRRSRPRTAGWSSAARRRSSGPGCAGSSASPEWPRPARRSRPSPAGGEHGGDLVAGLEASSRQKTVGDWLDAALRRPSIPCGPVNDVGAALADEHTAARNARGHHRPPPLRHGPAARVPGAGRRRDAHLPPGTAAQRGPRTTSPEESWAWTRSRWWRCGRPARSAMPSRHTARTPPTPLTASTPQPVTMIAEELAEWGRATSKCRPRSGPQRCGTCSTGSERRWVGCAPAR